MRIAIIGATGMLGHHTALAALERGHELTVIHRRGSDLGRLEDLTFTSAEADLTQPETLVPALEEADAVIQCAGYYPTEPRPWQEDVQAALEQMEGFYDACERAGVGRIVYLGAAIALKRPDEDRPGNADDSYPSQPSVPNGYLQSKWALDDLARKKAKGGLPVVIGIPAMTFGEFDYGPTTGRLIRDVANGDLPAYVKGDRNVIYAGDAGRGLVLACESGRVGERYLFTGENVTMDDLITRIARTADAPVPKSVPLRVAKTLSRVQGLRYRWLGGPLPKIDDTAIAVLSYGQFLEGEKSRKELGFQAEVGTDEAIRRALDWFRSVGYVR